jgi:hypothetical protein
MGTAESRGLQTLSGIAGAKDVGNVYRDDFVRHKTKGYLGCVLDTVESLLDPDAEDDERIPLPPGYE